MFLNNKKSKKILFVFFAIIIASFVISGCDNAKDAMDQASEVAKKTADKAGEMAKDAAEKAGETAKDAAEKVSETAEKVADKATETAGDVAKKVTDVVAGNNLVGVWTGKLDSRVTTLSITKQDGNNFEGKITINYRTPINQDVKGSYNEETKTITMADQLHSRFKGKYSGKLSDDGKTFSGTFTTLVDKKNFNFSLHKK